MLGAELDDAESRTWIGRTLADIYAATPEHAEALSQAYVDFNLANLEQLQTDVAGIDALLDALADAGVTVGVATSKRRPAAERSLAASGITDKVQLVSTLEDVTEHKHLEQQYLRAQRLESIGPAAARVDPAGRRRLRGRVRG